MFRKWAYFCVGGGKRSYSYSVGPLGRTIPYVEIYAFEGNRWDPLFKRYFFIRY